MLASFFTKRVRLRINIHVCIRVGVVLSARIRHDRRVRPIYCYVHGPVHIIRRRRQIRNIIRIHIVTHFRDTRRNAHNLSMLLILLSVFVTPFLLMSAIV